MKPNIEVSYYLSDLNPHRDKSIGISNYTTDLLHAIDISKRIGIHVVESKSSLTFPDALYRTRLPFSTDSIPSRIAADFISKWPLNRKSSQIIHFTKGLIPINFRSHKKIVITIHDMILIHYWVNYPESRSKHEWKFWLYILKRSIILCDVIITVSDHAKRKIENFISEWRLPNRPICVTYEGSSFERFTKVVSRVSEKQPRFVAFCSTLPHKKTQRLLELWSHRTVAQKYSLSLIGKVPDSCHNLTVSRTDVECLGHLSQLDLINYLKHSAGLIMASEVEGFGLPIIEAFYLGTPAIAVRGTACQELLGGREDLTFVLETFESFDQALRNLLAMSPKEIVSQADKMEEKFAWSSVGSKTIGIYEDLCRPL